MIKGVTHAHLGLIWYHSEPSDVQTSFLVGDFFAASYSKTALNLGHLAGSPRIMFLLYSEFSFEEV